MSEEQFLPSFEGTWARLSQVSVNGAEYNSRERQPHPKCLEGTRVDLLTYIYELLDDPEKNRLIWLHGTAGVGKSAVAFTVAERMRGIKVTEQTKVEKRLGGTFFFSRKHAKRCTAGYFFVTLVYQLAINFPSIRNDVNRAIRDDPALLNPDKPLYDQMEALFLQPLRKLQLRLRGCPPLTFVVDALDECTSEPELIDLILSLARALREPDLPVTHILLTSRSESHICKAFRDKKVQPLLCEIPVKISGEGVATMISLDGADVDKDIYIFLQHSFAELATRHSDFPQPSDDDLVKLASRAGRRFIVASTMMKFIIDNDDDPHGRLQLMLKLTSELLLGTEVYKLYDGILSTCADPKRAYIHLSIVTALADPLPISQISSLLGPGLGWDVQTTLIQLRSVMDIPADSTLPVNIYHSSIRDYVSDPSNCSLPQVCGHDIPSPHSLLADSSLRLMVKNMPESTALLDVLSELKKQSQAMQSEDPRQLKNSMSFLVRTPEPLSALICMLWLRGDRSLDLQYWLGTMDGCAWMQTINGRDWLETEGGRNWLETEAGRNWLETEGGRNWLETEGERQWVETQARRNWLETEGGRIWLETQRGQEWLQNEGGRDWLQAKGGQGWLQIQGGRKWLQNEGGQQWLHTQRGREWLQTQGGRDWLQNEGGRQWLQTQGGRNWLQTPDGQDWLDTEGGSDWLQTQGRRQWLQNEGGRDWLQTQGGRDWLQAEGGRNWLQTQRGQDWLQAEEGRDWLQTQGGRDWLQTQGGRNWLQTPDGQDWLPTQRGRDWLQTLGGRNWLQTPHGQAWQSTPVGSVWATTEEFSSTLEAIRNYIIFPELALLPTFKVVQQFRNLPDFLIFPVFLAFIPQNHLTSASPEVPNREIIHAMNLLIAFANEAQERSRSSSDALKYACQNWVVHLSRAPNPWDDTLDHIFKAFWNCHLLSWLERQWCLKGLRSSLDILSKGQKLGKAIVQFEPLTHPIPGTQKQMLRAPFPSSRPNTSVLHVGTSRKRTSDEFAVNSNSALQSNTSNSSSKRQK